MKIKKAILGIAITIIFLLFVAYAIDTIYPSPEYKDFCEEKATIINTQQECESIGGEWNPYDRPKPVTEDEIFEGYCDRDFECRQDYDAARDVYNRNVFFVSVIIGIITLVIAALLSLESVSAGLMGGSVLLIIYGTIRYWGDMSNILRTILLGVALAILIWLGYKKIEG